MTDIKMTRRTPEEEAARLNALIERSANWLIQGRGGDHDYIRADIRRMEKQRDAILNGETPEGPGSVRGVAGDHPAGW